METLNNHTRVLQSWRFLSTGPLSGADNMRLDAECLHGIEQDHLPATLRLFRFSEPTLSYGRLQKGDAAARHMRDGWAIVQRPTGGGIVHHNDDLCFSLCWKVGQPPLPERPQDQYRWIHAVVLQMLAPNLEVRMASCCDISAPKEPFPIRNCFTNPVGYDLLEGETKIVGGALRCTRRATLYQGSLQVPGAPGLEPRLRVAFRKALS